MQDIWVLPYTGMSPICATNCVFRTWRRREINVRPSLQEQTGGSRGSNELAISSVTFPTRVCARKTDRNLRPAGSVTQGLFQQVLGAPTCQSLDGAASNTQ